MSTSAESGNSALIAFVGNIYHFSFISSFLSDRSSSETFMYNNAIIQGFGFPEGSEWSQGQHTPRERTD